MVRTDGKFMKREALGHTMDPLSKDLTTLEVIMSAGQNSQKVLSKNVMDHTCILQKKNGFDGA